MKKINTVWCSEGQGLFYREGNIEIAVDFYIENDSAIPPQVLVHEINLYVVTTTSGKAKVLTETLLFSKDPSNSY